MRGFRFLLESSVKLTPQAADLHDTPEVRRLDYLDAMDRCPPTEYPLGSPEGARAYVLRAWGSVRAASYLNLAAVALADGAELRRWRREKRAKVLTRDEARVVQILDTRYGRERIFYAALREVAKADAVFAERLTARSAFLASVACGISPPPEDEADLRGAESRWRKRHAERIRALEAVSSD